MNQKLDLLIRSRDADPAFVPGLAKLYDIEENSSEYDKLLDDLEEYCSSVRPVPVSLRNPYKIKPLLDSFRKEKERNAMRPTRFWVVLVGNLLFKQLSDGEIETTHSYNECAAFSEHGTARNVGLKLDAMGAWKVRVVEITNEIRKPETIVNTLDGLGFSLDHAPQ